MDKLREYLKQLNFNFDKDVLDREQYRIEINNKFFRLIVTEECIFFIEVTDFILPSIVNDEMMWDNNIKGINECIKYLHKHEVFCIKLRKLKINKLLNE